MAQCTSLLWVREEVSLLTTSSEAQLHIFFNYRSWHFPRASSTWELLVGQQAHVDRRVVLGLREQWRRIEVKDVAPIRGRSAVKIIKSKG